MAQKKMPDSFNSTPIIAPTNSMKQRMFFGVFAALLLFVGYIVVTLYDVAVIKSEYYRAKANGQQIDSFTINANRGTIYDRNGKILAQSTTVWDVILNPVQIRNVDGVDEEGNPDNTKINLIAKELSRILGLDEKELLDRIMNSETQYYIAKKKVDRETQDKVEAFILENEINYYSVMLM